MKIAVINSGSSSIKFQLFDMNTELVLASVLVEKIGEFSSSTIFKHNEKKVVITSVIDNHHEGLKNIIILLSQNNIIKDFSSLDAIGHRVVHGGEEFKKSTLIDEYVINKIRELIPLAPLHNPANLEGITISRKKAPFVKQIAVFDTAFHSTMPKEAYLYALDYEMYEKHKIRRYGFHGTSHSYVLKETAKIFKKSVDELNIITLHLGNGASACAIQNGKSIDTSMGFTPLEGLIMGTRSGDVDPAIIIYMQRELGMGVDEVDNLLNKKSGLLGICGSNDVRSIIESDSEKSKLALNMMIRRIKKYIGSYMALLGRVDAIVFTGGIGENSQYIRDKVLDNHLAGSIKILVINTDEELEIARECIKVLEK
ncbi:acetate kinase [Candidatus Sulfurimonas marisnigri]|uniref:Acetate kinase n=1 Tax=Candidatus Sulfurimonas marisnigri TaxID=2740405 RepID=A0A7S7M062_9BACT|nr:acetate kinase [Candidatus Sulfurimonas marisnigri]QOY54123.1 acetate kinase [Candidatus Sulfurimonas marisnigri]